MRVWNVAKQEINQLYNNINYCIKANEVKDLGDDVALFLLSKKEIRGRGLVQFKLDDSKEHRYKEGMRNIYDWSKEKYADFERHCEERAAQSLNPLAPHKAIVEYKTTIDAYEKWEVDGMPLEGLDLEDKDEKAKVFACPHCSKEFDVKVAYFGHLRSHQKGNDVNTGTVGNESKGKG